MPLHARVINCPCAGSNGVPMAFRQQAIQPQNPVLRVCFLDPLLHQFSSLELLKGGKKGLWQDLHAKALCENAILGQ